MVGHRLHFDHMLDFNHIHMLVAVKHRLVITNHKLEVIPLVVIDTLADTLASTQVILPSTLTPPSTTDFIVNSV